MRFLGLSKPMKKLVKAVLVSGGLLTVASSASAQGAVGQNQPPDQWAWNSNTERGRDCTVSAMIDGGPDNLLGTFLIVSYSVAYTTLTVVVDGLGRAAPHHAGRRQSLRLDGHLYRWRVHLRAGQVEPARAGDAGRVAHHRAGLDAGRQHGRATQAVTERLCRPVSESRPGTAGPVKHCLPKKVGVVDGEGHVAAVEIGRVGMKDLARRIAAEHAGARQLCLVDLATLIAVDDLAAGDRLGRERHLIVVVEIAGPGRHPS